MSMSKKEDPGGTKEYMGTSRGAQVKLGENSKYC